MPRIQFVHIDIMIGKILNLVNDSQKAGGIMICNINPFMVASAILFISHKIKRDLPLAMLWVKQYEQDLENTIIILLEMV